MSEFQFIINYLSIIISHHTKGSGVLSVDELLTLTLTFLLTKTAHKDQDVFRPVVKNTSKVLGKKKLEELTTVNFSEACDKVHASWTSKLSPAGKSEIAKLLSSQIRLIAQIDETGFVSFSNTLCAYLKINKVGTEDITSYDWYNAKNLDNQSIIEGEPIQTITNIEYNRKAKLHSKRKSVNLLEDNELNRYWDEISHGFDTDKPYFWQLHLQNSQYENLKDKICACIKVHPENRNYVIDNHSWAVACYIAEYYKRDWCGNDGTKNELSEIGLSQNYERIFEKCNISDSFLYAIQSEDRQNHRWQDSLRMLGGLPINYIVKKNIANTLLTSLVEVFQSDFSEGQSKIDAFIEKIDGCRCGIGGYALTQSILQGHSIFNYIQSLLNGHFPFLSECDISPYKDFISSLNKVKKERDKFNLEWIYVRDEYAIAKELRISMLGFDEGALSKIQISESRLIDWGFKTLPNSLVLNVVFKSLNQEIAKVDNIAYFVQTNINGAVLYTKTGLGDSVIVKDIPQEWFDEVVVEISGQDEIHKITYSVNQYAQLYLAKDWTYSSNNNRGSSSVVVYNPSIYRSCAKDVDENELLFSNGCKANWCSIDNLEFSIEEVGKTRPKKVHFNSPYRILIEPVLSRTDIKYTDGKVTHCFFSEDTYDTELIPLIFGKRFRIYYQEKAEIEEKKEITSDYTLSYFDNDKWNEGLPSTQGVFNICVSYKGKEKQERIYFIPYKEGKFIDRDCENNVVRFSNLELNNVYFPQEVCLSSDNYDVNTLWDYVSLCPKNKRNVFYYKDELSMLKYPGIVIPFLLGSKDNYIVLPVYRCKSGLYLFLSGKGIKRYHTNELLTGIPFVLQNKFNAIDVSPQGVVCHSYENHLWDLSMVSELWTSYHTRKQITTQKKLYYICSKRHYVTQNNTVEYDLGATGIDQYNFYFWDYKNNPIKINGTYENEKLVLHDVPFPPNITDPYILFQSLADDVSPRHYCAPLVSKTFRIIQCIDCMKVAINHNVYFRMFSPLKKLVETDVSDGIWIERVLRECLFPYLRDQQYSFDSIKHWCYRFAEEFSFDWFLIGPKTWEVCLRNAQDKLDLKECIKKILEHNPNIHEPSEKRYLTNLLDADWSSLSPTRTTGVVNDVLKMFKGKPFDFTRKNEEQRLRIIKDFYNTSNVCLKIYSQIIN